MVWYREYLRFVCFALRENYLGPGSVSVIENEIVLEWVVQSIRLDL